MGFREDFVWGAASSAYQTEGYPAADGGGQSVWDVFCRSPGAIANGEDGSIACDGYHRFREDIKNSGRIAHFAGRIVLFASGGK